MANVIRLYNDKKYGPNIDRIAVALPEKTVLGDVNADGVFSVADVVLLQKRLLNVPGVKLADQKAGDLCENGRLDVADLCMMKSMLIENS